MITVKCPFCSKEIENDSFYCDQCGQELRVCPLGHGFKKGKICSECGTKLVEAKNAADNQQAQPAVTTLSGTLSQPPPVEVENVIPQQTETAEKTYRPQVFDAEPKYLVSAVLNTRLELKNGAIIGRKTGDYVNVFNNQGYISRTHARVQKNDAGVWEIVDLDSANGTFLNEVELKPNQPYTFKIGDTIAFYDIKFLVSD